jgi:hypothetical protein
MNPPALIVKRIPYEEPYHVQIDLFASNGRFSARSDFYCSVDNLSEIGAALRSFPKHLGDEYVYVYGSEDPDKKFYRYIKLRAYTVGSAGKCAIQITINTNDAEPEEGRSNFSIQAYPIAINKLGELFSEFSQLRHLEFHWSETDSSLHDEYVSE